MSSEKQKKRGLKNLARALDRAINSDPAVISAMDGLRELGFEARLKIRLRAFERDPEAEGILHEENNFSESDKKMLGRMLINVQ